MINGVAFDADIRRFTQVARLYSICDFIRLAVFIMQEFNGSCCK